MIVGFLDQHVPNFADIHLFKVCPTQAEFNRPKIKEC